MNRLQLLVATSAFAVLLSCAALQPTSRLIGESAVDRALHEFGANHASCQLWTNWQKICSRTGPGGSTRCNTDPSKPVEPSAPFCVRDSQSGYGVQLADTSERDRFCAARKTVESESDPGQHTNVCSSYDPERPFNGRRLAALLHPDCAEWRDYQSYSLVCTSKGDAKAGIPTCEQLAAQQYEHPRQLVCSRWIGRASCHPYPVMARPRTPGDLIIGSDGNKIPAHGLLCEQTPN